MYLIIYSFFILFVFSAEVFRKKHSKVDFLTIFNFSFLLSYLLPSFLWVAVPEIFSSNLPYQLSYNAAATFEVFFTLFFSYMSFYFFYTVFNKVRLPFYIMPVALYNERKMFNKMMLVMLFFTMLVLIGVFLMGGILSFIAAGVEARHNHSSNGIVGYLRYFYSAFPVIFIAIALFFCCRKKLGIGSFYSYFLFSIFLIGMIALIANGGRATLVFVFINIFFFLYMLDKIKFRIKTLFFSVAVLYISLFIVFDMHNISSAIINGSDVNLAERFSVFSDKLVAALLGVFQYSDHLLFIITEFFKNPDLYNYPRYGSDNISALVILIPGIDSSDLGLYKLPDYISQDVMGRYNGAIPPGWIGWALLNGGYFWLFIKGVLASYLAVTLDKSKVLFTRSVGLDFGGYFYFILVLLLYGILFSGAAANLLRAKIGLLLFFVFICFIPLIRVVKFKLIQGKKVNLI